MAREKEAKKSGCIGGTIKLIFILFLGLIGLGVLSAILSPRGRVVPVTAPPQTAPTAVVETPRMGPTLLPEVSAFLAEHKEFGSAVSSSDVPNWASGKRQNVTTDKGMKLLFYEKDGAIMTVYENDPPRPRAILWGGTEKR